MLKANPGFCYKYYSLKDESQIHPAAQPCLYNHIMLTMPIGLASIDVQCSDS